LVVFAIHLSENADFLATDFQPSVTNHLHPDVPFE
jgi:hypothetical protein